MTGSGVTRLVGERGLRYANRPHGLEAQANRHFRNYPLAGHAAEMAKSTRMTRIGQQVGEHIKRKLDVFERYWSAGLTRHIACPPDCQRFSDLPVQGIVRLNTISQERR